MTASRRLRASLVESRPRLLLLLVMVLCGMAPLSALEDDDDEYDQRLSREGRWVDLEDEARCRLANAEATHGRDSRDAAGHRGSLVGSLWRQERFTDPELETLLYRNIAYYETAPGNNNVTLADCLHTLGVVRVRTGKFEAALVYFKHVLALREAVLGRDSLDVTYSLYSISNTLKSLGHIEEASAHTEQALRICDHLDDPSIERWKASLQLLLAEFLGLRGRFSEAADLQRQVLGVYERELGPDHYWVAIARNNLAGNLRMLGDLAGARALLDEAVRVADKALGPDHVIAVGIRDSLAEVAEEMSDYASARRVYESSLVRIEASLGPVSERKVGGYLRIGALCLKMGDLADAEHAYERARDVARELLAESHSDQAPPLVGLAVVARRRGDLDLSSRRLEAARNLIEMAEVIDPKQLAMALHELGLTRTDQGELGEATLLYEQALDLLCNDDGSALDRAQVLMSRADLLEVSGDLLGARDHCEQALEIRRQMLAASHPYIAEALAGLAGIEARLGRRARAVALAMEAETIARDHLYRTVRGGVIVRQALSYARHRPSGIDTLIALAAEVDARPALDALIRSRGLVLDEAAARQHRLAQLQVTDSNADSAALAAAMQRVATLTLRSTEGSDRSRDQLTDARLAREHAERELAALDAGSTDTVSTGLNEVARALPKDAALVSFARHRGLDGIARYGAFVLVAANTVTSPTPRFVKLGLAATIDRLVAEWRAQITEQPHGLSALRRQREIRYRAAAAELRQTVWDPVAATLGSTATVFVVPDGALSFVEFTTLPTNIETYLVETGPRIHYLGTERDLVRARMRDASPNPISLLLLGAVASSDVAAGLTPDVPRPMRDPAPAALRANLPCGLSATDQTALPGVELELDALASLWRRDQGPSDNRVRTRDAKLVTGEAATEATFKSLAPGRDVIHIAGHGFFLAGPCTSPDSDRSVGARGLSAAVPSDAEPGLGEDAMLLSGIVLADAEPKPDQDLQPDQDDGLLTAAEIATLDLSGVSWVVLSACDTGIGKLQSGEGVLGLRRAFQMAGAATLITSLWRVPDSGTQDWMVRLYEARIAGRSTAHAVRDAKLAVLAQRRAVGQDTHPFHWGAFVASGDWR